MKKWKKLKKEPNEWAHVITKDMALEIKKLRETGTWRWVAARFSENHPELGVCNGNQIEGMLLCEAAEKVLKIKFSNKD